MAEVKTFTIVEKFKGTEGLYRYLNKNSDLFGRAVGISIQKPLRARRGCLIAQERITGRNILFYASKSEITKSLGELIVIAGKLNTHILVFFMPSLDAKIIESLDWLKNICMNDYNIVAVKAEF